MPWNECNPTDERLKFIARRLDGVRACRPDRLGDSVSTNKPNLHTSLVLWTLAALFYAAIKTPGSFLPGGWHVREAIVFLLPEPGGLVCMNIPRLLYFQLLTSLLTNSPHKEKREPGIYAKFPFLLFNLAPQHGLEPRT